MESDRYPRQAYAWYVIGGLNLIYVVAFLNRQLLFLMVDPIRRDFGLSDTEISLIMGFSFSVFYAFLGLPLGRLADTRSRKTIITASIILWSLCSASFGIAKNFAHLFLARMGLGIGQAGLSPATYSMVSDYFPPRRRALAMSVILTGIHIGGGISLLIGGILLGLVAEEGVRHIPFFGTVYPWQIVFFYVGLPGLLLAVLMLTVREPARLGPLRFLKRDQEETIPKTSLMDFFGYVRANRTVLLLFILGIGFHALANIETRVWSPTFFIRTYGWTAEQTGVILGAIVAVFSVLGILAGGRLSGWFLDRGYGDANVRVLLVSVMALVPLRLLYPLMPTAGLALIFLIPALFFAPFALGAIAAAIQDVFPNRMRALATAFYLSTFSIVGLGLGPTAIALVTDYVFRDDAALRYSLALVTPLATFVSVVLFLGVLKRYPALKAYAQAWTG